MTLCRRLSEMTHQRTSVLENTANKLLLAVCFAALLITPTYGFVANRRYTQNKNRVHPVGVVIANNHHRQLLPLTSRTKLYEQSNNSNYLTDEDHDEDEEPLLVADVRGRPAGVVLEDLDWRVAKLRLEEANTRRFLKAGPRFLPYEECRKWVQAWGNRWQSAQEWENWIAAGEKRNSYIPSRPEEYFSRRGEWISWEHFLGVDDSSANNSSD